jgi:beta-alanine--pyruvate transaminase
MDIYEREGLFARARELAKHWEDAIHALKSSPHVIDIRNIGLMGAVELQPRPGAPTARGYDAFVKCFERGVLVRYTGDTLALSPPLIVEKKEIDQIFTTIGDVLKTVE